MIKKLKKENFDDLIHDGDVLVDFSASWCGPCKMLEPVLEEFSSNRNKVKVISVDVDEHEKLAKSFGIMSVPTLIAYKNGKMINKNTGFVTLDVIESWYDNK